MRAPANPASRFQGWSVPSPWKNEWDEYRRDAIRKGRLREWTTLLRVSVTFYFRPRDLSALRELSAGFGKSCFLFGKSTFEEISGRFEEDCSILYPFFLFFFFFFFKKSLNTKIFEYHNTSSLSTFVCLNKCSVRCKNVLRRIYKFEKRHARVLKKKKRKIEKSQKSRHRLMLSAWIFDVSLDLFHVLDQNWRPLAPTFLALSPPLRLIEKSPVEGIVLAFRKVGAEGVS